MSAAGEDGETGCVRRCDYREFPFAIDAVNLDFDLAAGEGDTIVQATLRCRRKADADASEAMVLHGEAEHVTLVGIYLNGVPLKDNAGYSLKGSELKLQAPASGEFILGIVVRIRPHENFTGEGLYKSGGFFCTQCEAESFRRIIFFPDRPDVLSKYTVRVAAEKERYPILLSNGNLCAEGELDGGRHFAVWVDPFPKPSYLFALVAGRLVKRADSFTTKSGRVVDLALWTESHNAHKTEHAMNSLKKAMVWDEATFNLEYDLGIFNIVAVDDFNCGAMENKSLNLFNSSCVLCDPKSATDANFEDIEGTVAHEYFHNWTGNRVTCRDWFQLSLKEGLTVYRDQEFTSDMQSRTVKRVSDVAALRSSQFTEDSGAMAHPVRPEEVESIDNFYSATVYEKGAEVIRMYETLLGRDAFREGVQLYLQRHDGSAVACTDFLQAMADTSAAQRGGAPHPAFETFERWYSQAGTPHLRIEWSHDVASHTVTLKCKQTLQKTPDWKGPEEKKPQVLPIRVGMLGPDGTDMTMQVKDDDVTEPAAKRLASTTLVLVMTQAEQTFTIRGIVESPTPSLLRGFTAPVELEVVPALTTPQLAFLLSHDSDEFNRYEAARSVGRRMIDRAIDRRLLKESPASLEEEFASADDAAAIEAYRSVLTSDMDEAFIAETMKLPDVEILIDTRAPEADPLLIHEARQACCKILATKLKADMQQRVQNCFVAGPYEYKHSSAAKRALRNYCLVALANAGVDDGVAYEAFTQATHMTDEQGALAAVCCSAGENRDKALAAFFEKHKEDVMVVRKWFRMASSSNVPGNLSAVKKLLEHPSFDDKNPNTVRSVVLGFAASVVNFHATDGSGYAFMADMGLKIDHNNPQIGAQILQVFSQWRKFAEPFRGHMKQQLEKLKVEKLSPNSSEVVSKSLA